MAGRRPAPEAIASGVADQAFRGPGVHPRVHPRLAVADVWTAEALEAAVRAYSAETGAKLGKVAQPLRAALTGRAVSPPVFTVLEVLGREKSLERMKLCAA